MTLLKILKTEREFEPLFELVEFDPRTNKQVNKIQEFHKLGIMVDCDGDSWIGLKTGKYDTVQTKFNEYVYKCKNSAYPQMADKVRLYDITKMPSDDVEKLLTHSGIVKNLLNKKEYPYTQGTSFDEYELVE
ncbi:hypothetical protein HYO65_gp275 [Tenacibaculum phage PTm1]|uniref:Uncharacterized protein n=2 Tax=Shirahamavirus PTm1 TaxID=2846435 RepID=A0A5S9HXH9_9CAUD|nr:hypothetical protein HYO65_gp275 [Tenacibaculum phage PTm1]BBI90667.1 hypothetical protein [Tenacibaculum phage PTm1]BBI90972.1 hypothetical protein [Tenacibaculum phage PTm5]